MNVRRNYALLILFLVGSISLMDKTIIAYLLEPIKKEFALSDTELGLMSGIAFAVFFAVAGLPMGYVADRVNRRNLIAANVLPIYGWRGTFIAAGLPAIVLVPLLLLTVREPSRVGATVAEHAPSFTQTLRFIAGMPALLHLMAAITLTTMTMNGIGIWSMSYFVRVHHIDLGQIGPVLGFAYPIPAIIGTFAGGVVADRLAIRDERWRAWVPALGALACVPVTAALVLAQDWSTTLLLWAAYGVTAPIWSGPGYGLSLSLVEPRMRATQTAILFLLTNLVGFGLAPMIVGMLSDLLAPRFGGESLRYAMLAIGLVNLWAALHFALAGRGLKKNRASI